MDGAIRRGNLPDTSGEACASSATRSMRVVAQRIQAGAVQGFEASE